MAAGFEHDPGWRRRWRQSMWESRTAPPDSSRMNANDRLPCAPLGRVEGSDSFVEGRDVTDARPQSSVLHPLDDLTQLGTIGLDNEVEPRNAFRLSKRASRIAIAYAAKGYRSISLEQIGPPLGSSSCVH